MADHEKDNSAAVSGGGEPLPAAISALSAEDRADLFNSLKDKLQNLTGKNFDSLFIDSLSPKVKKRVEVLREIQSQYDDLEKKYVEEQVALESKYQKLYEPLYTKRYEVVNGVAEVEAETKDVVTEQENKTAEEKGVPNFWLKAMKNIGMLADEITERDEGALKYLNDIKWFRLDNPKGFKLEFLFDSNPYFKNSVLTKIYHLVDDDFEGAILEKAIGTEIEWYPGKCLTQKVLKKKPKKGSKNAKPITKTENCESFFKFFKPPQITEEDDDIDGDLVEFLEDQMEQDFNIGSVIAEKLVPHAVSWYTGEAVQGDELDDLEDADDNEEDEDEDGDDEDADEEDDHQEDSKEEKKKRGKARRASS